ncbi:uncharacterized protein LOC127703075 [Mytilus californianus]|uniref:uncharacterized protein LOC127703075 n=1 Tax=Mytilus californianus TaxID=6549 RepID=UPI002247E4D8|nr:uncharacterized protein LOC127703075 [Mytilus californianus]XP_052063423.1 uncharacterized protein LOC127703075 [Mytilus californianus]XP_052063424.1 uncharacterized protein LOC127703075 [Mytilus californianus]XP_052063425.1 uncharacterized protein LOC127703075 [Mytilus californianus]XP_052063426.1 uncharacterized protein LOC127703075 [Mytilus californianus]
MVAATFANRGFKYIPLVLAVLVIIIVIFPYSRQINMSTTVTNVMHGMVPSVVYFNSNKNKTDTLCQNCTKINPSFNTKPIFQNYFFPESKCDKKLLVYECAGICGGLGDREKGILSAFLLSLLTQRTFVVLHRTPCEIKKFFEPRIYDWSKCSASVSQAKSKGFLMVNYIDAHGNLPQSFENLRGYDIWKEHVVFIHVNIRLNNRIMSHPIARETIPWILTSPPEFVMSQLWHALFKPEAALLTHLNNFITNCTLNSKRKLIAVHIRTRFLQKDLSAHVKQIFAFLDNYNDKSNFTLYIASDSEDIKNQAKKRYLNFASLNRHVVHIDETNDACDGMYTAIFEQLVLSRADILVMTQSGFSRMAAYIRGKPDEIYLYHAKDKSDESFFEQITLETLPKMFPIS